MMYRRKSCVFLLKKHWNDVILAKLHGRLNCIQNTKSIYTINCIQNNGERRMVENICLNCPSYDLSKSECMMVEGGCFYLCYEQEV